MCKEFLFALDNFIPFSFDDALNSQQIKLKSFQNARVRRIISHKENFLAHQFFIFFFGGGGRSLTILMI